MAKRFSCVGLLLGALLFLGPSCAGPEGDSGFRSAPMPTRSSSILQGYPSLGDPEVFFILIQSGTSEFICSSTLIGQRTLLTAAHCVVDADAIVATNQLEPLDPATNDLAPNLVTIPARIWRHHPQYNPTSITNDIALIGLEHPPWAAPKEWNSASIADLPGGTPLRLVGYGDSQFTAAGESGAGIKRTGNALLEKVDATQLELSSIQAATCFGDSGGPSFHTFPDGVERVVGLTSYGNQICGENEVATRVDAFADFIQSTLAEFDPPSCDADGLCVQGCMPEDVDCTCAADGVCNADCPDPSTDPDCADACAANNLCARVPCGVADADCRATGADCMTEADCAGTLCVSDAQHAEAYCSHSCSGDGDCETGYSCQADACRHIPLPEAAPNAVCTPGSQFCTGGTVCARPSDGGVVECRRPCGEDLDCPTQQHCAGDPDATYCDVVATVVTPPTQTPTSSKGCSSAGGLPGLWTAAFVAAWLGGTARRRRTSGPAPAAPSRQSD